MDAVTDLPDQLAQEPVALGLLDERRAVVALEQFLRAREVRRHLRVVGDVELAAQHPIFHPSHTRLEDTRVRSSDAVDDTHA